MRRALHYVFKIGDRAKSIQFYKETLGMKVLRHEEFEEGCQATCNGPYDGKWSKTMIGYGDEARCFVLELTYNYDIGHYQLGNDYKEIDITRPDIQAVQSLQDPEGRKFNFLPANQRLRAENDDPVQSVAISVSNLEQSINFWSKTLGLQIMTRTQKSALLAYDISQCHVKLSLVDQVHRGSAFGRIAFACPTEELSTIEKTVRTSGNQVLTPMLSLDTPGKAAVQVVIVADPDGHEICFVGDEGFRELSVTDANAEQLLNQAMTNDKSAEWFGTKKGGKMNT